MLFGFLESRGPSHRAVGLVRIGLGLVGLGRVGLGLCRFWACRSWALSVLGVSLFGLSDFGLVGRTCWSLANHSWSGSGSAGSSGGVSGSAVLKNLQRGGPWGRNRRRRNGHIAVKSGNWGVRALAFAGFFSAEVCRRGGGAGRRKIPFFCRSTEEHPRQLLPVHRQESRQTSQTTRDLFRKHVQAVVLGLTVFDRSSQKKI